MRFFIFLIITFVATTIAAQQLELDTIEIKSLRLSNSSSSPLFDIEVIDAEDISKSSFNSLDDLIQIVPGVQMLSRGGFGVQSDISIRGSSFNQVLVLIDGVRANDPLTGHFNMYLPINQMEISRIEILKGAASAIYGTEAIGGVINFITQKGKRKKTVEFETLYGSNQTTENKANLGFSLGDLNVGLNGSYVDSDGHVPSDDSINYDFKLSNAGIALDYIGNKWSIAGRTSYDIRDFNARYFYTRSNADQSREKVSRQWNQLNADFYLAERHHLNFDVAYQSTQDSFLFNPLFTGNFHTTSHVDLHVFDEWSIKDNISVTLGANYLNQKVESNDRGNHNRNRYGVFSNSALSIEKWNLNLGLNLTHDQIFETVLSPSFGISYQLSDWLSFKVAYAESIRSADFTENYVSTNLPNLSGGRNLGNPLLEAERIKHYDFGLDYKTKTFFVGLSLFRRSGDNLIDFALTPGSEINNAQNISDSLDYFFAQNVSQLNTQGMELAFGNSFRLQKLYNQTNLAFSLYDFDNPTGVISKYVAAGAKQLIQFDHTVSTDKWNLMFQLQYKNREGEEASVINKQLEDQYLVSNIRFSYLLLESRLRLKLRVNNIFDQRYSEILGAELPGRWIMAGINFSI